MVQTAAAAARSAYWERQKAGLMLLLLFCTAPAAAEHPREGSGRLLLDAGADQARFPLTELVLSTGKQAPNLSRVGMLCQSDIHAARCWQLLRSTVLGACSQFASILPSI